MPVWENWTFWQSMTDDGATTSSPSGTLGFFIGFHILHYHLNTRETIVYFRHNFTVLYMVNRYQSIIPLSQLTLLP